MERITVDLISSKEFSFEAKGYNRQEVDNFLDDICEELERMDKEIAELRQKTTAVYQAPAAPAASGVTEEQEQSFREVLESAVQVKNDTIRNGFVVFVGVDIASEHLKARRLVLLQKRRARIADKNGIRHDCLHRLMQKTGLRAVAFIDEDGEIALDLESGRKRCL